MMPGRFFRWSAFAPLLVASSLVAFNLPAQLAHAETLPLPGNLTDLSSDEGEKYLLESSALAAYFPIADNFVTQKTQAYCGVASIVMVLNAVGAPAPSTPEYQPYHTFTQDNLLDEHTDAVLPRDVLARQGMTLDQLGGLLSLHPVTIDVHHAADGGLDAFRNAARDYLAAKDHFVIVNYLRKAIGQQTGGHISPLAAYDAKVDRFLILDVARYKYPPVWVTASDLFDAMNTTDAANDNKTRGYVLVTKAGVAN
jgi:Phytochelatin synthase